MTLDGLLAKTRGWLIWLAPFAVLALLIGWESDWGREWRHVPAKDVVVKAQPVAIDVLPEYQAVASPAMRHDMVDRTLFNPTRRPAPVLAAEAAKPRIQRGQFALTGTIVVDGKSTAFLKEVAGGRSRRVIQGEQINGMVLAEVKPDRVRLTVGDESEELFLKVMQNSRPTVQPVVAAAPAAAPVAGGGAAAPAAVTATQDNANTLAQRRAAARAGEAAAGAAAAAPAPPPVAVAPRPVDPAAAAAADAAWGKMDEAYRQRAATQQGPRKP